MLRPDKLPQSVESLLHKRITTSSLLRRVLYYFYYGVCCCCWWRRRWQQLMEKGRFWKLLFALGIKAAKKRGATKERTWEIFWSTLLSILLLVTVCYIHDRFHEPPELPSRLCPLSLLLLLPLPLIIILGLVYDTSKHKVDKDHLSSERQSLKFI